MICPCSLHLLQDLSRVNQREASTNTNARANNWTASSARVSKALRTMQNFENICPPWTWGPADNYENWREWVNTRVRPRSIPAYKWDLWKAIGSRKRLGFLPSFRETNETSRKNKWDSARLTLNKQNTMIASRTTAPSTATGITQLGRPLATGGGKSGLNCVRTWKWEMQLRWVPNASFDSRVVFTTG